MDIVLKVNIKSVYIHIAILAKIRSIYINKDGKDGYCL